MSEQKKVIRVGSRKSELALIQTKYVISRLQKLYPNEKFEIHTMTTMGDRVLNISLPKIGEKALFTRDLEEALSNGTVDFVVHSLKDLPTSLPAGMAIGAVLEREDPRDALVLNNKFNGKTLNSLSIGSVIGTSSLRRAAQLARSYPHLKVQDIRGNLNTRLAKLDADNSIFSGIMLARAGLVRMGWEKRISQTIEPDDIMYAVGQGALAVECRSSDLKILEMLRKLNCIQTQCRILSERSFLKTLGGGCSAPVAVSTVLKPKEHLGKSSLELNISGAVWSLDGKIEVQGTTECLLDMDENPSKDDDDDIPRKKIKLGDSPPTSNTESKIENPLPIVDDSATTSGSEKSMDVKAFIKIHKDLFADNHPSADDNQNRNKSTDSGDKCPLFTPVGQDVMGKCPYFDTSKPEQTIIIEQSDKKSTEEVPKKCPFLESTSSKSETDKNIENINASLIDTKTLTLSVNKDERENEVINEELLFCGLYPHTNIAMELYERCDSLGRNLAMNLIENGALKVMETAQQEIRQSI